MARRRWHRRGDWLVMDDYTGFPAWGSESVKEDYYGRTTLKSNAEAPNPQDFVRAKDDPRPKAFYNNPDLETTVTECAEPYYIGQTNIRTPRGPASHLYDFGIGEMEIGCSFIVR